MKEKTIYYHDELNDDFKKTKLNRPPLKENYKYKRTNRFNNLLSDFLFFCIAKPVFYVINFFSGVKYHNVKNLKELKDKGAFIYSNHTTFYDMFTIQACVVRGKRTNIIGYSDTTSIPVVRHIGSALGYLPLPDTLKLTKAFQDSLDFYINEKKEHILIFPEAHVWPFYTKIRPFVAGSFHYPAKLNAPIIPIVTTYRKRKFRKKPGIDIRVGTPIYPKEELDLKGNKQYLRDACYEQMVEISNSVSQYEYIKYVKVEENK